jgi:predicted nicotinamide N-methyase
MARQRSSAPKREQGAEAPRSERTASSAADPDAPAAEIPGGWTERRFEIGGRGYLVRLPAAPDAFLDDPAVLELNRRDDYMPYWAFVWPAALHLSKRVARNAWPAGTRALEIGCGIGLVGLVALDRALDVTFTDYDRAAVELALFNARRHGHREARGQTLDWRAPAGDRFPLILGSDLLYELRNHEPILGLLVRMLAPGGEAWLGDAGRQHAQPFAALARERGFEVTLEDEHGRPLSEPHVGRYQLFIVRHVQQAARFPAS